MKILRNPIAVGVMAVLAAGVMVGNLFWPAIKRWRETRAATTATVATPIDAPLGALANTAPQAPVDADNKDSPTSHARPEAGRIDRVLVRSQLLRWMQASVRDPFLGIQLAGPEVPKGPPASQNLQVAAILRQTGSQLALVNGQVLTEGDRVAGYALERIEGDGIWVRGTNGLERVRIRGAVTESPPAAPAPTGHSVDTAPVPSSQPSAS